MYNFGKTPPRSIQGRGISSLLGEGCQVYYDNLFSVSGIGRLSDLFSVKVKEVGIDDLKFRALMLFGFFEAFRAQAKEGVLDEPIALEFGFDLEKAAFGVTFSLDGSDWEGPSEGFASRVRSKSCEHPFEVLLQSVYDLADHTVLRVWRAERRAEIITFLAIPGLLDVSTKQDMTILELVDEAPPVLAKVKVQAADMDESTRPDLKLQTNGAKDGPDEQDFEARFSRDKEEDRTVRISADKPHDQDDTVYRIAGEAPKDQKNPAQRFSVQGVLGKVWPFSRGEGAPGASAAASSNSLDPQTEEAVSVRDIKPHAPSEPIPEFKEHDVKEMTQYLSNSVSSGGSFFALGEKCKEMARRFRGSSDPAAQVFIETMSQELVAERVRMAEISGLLNRSVRQRELELQRREHQFIEDLRRKDESIRQKETALERSKEQVAQLVAQVERLKQSKSTGSDDAGLRQKYELSQRMINNLKDEKVKLEARIEEIKNQSVSAQKGAEATIQAELRSLKEKNEKLVRQNNQMKNLTDQLAKKVQKASGSTAEGAPAKDTMAEELKRRMEVQQKEIDRLKAKIDEQAKQETRRASELVKKDAELRTVKREVEQLKRAAGEVKKAG